MPDAEQLIQVSYSLQDPETQQRETEALTKVSKHLNAKDVLIVTKDEEAVLEKDGHTIRMVPLWKWLLEK